LLAAATILEMARYRFPAYNKAPTPRWVVMWDLQWQVIECQRLEPAADLSGAMAATIERLAGEGWEAEGDSQYSFVFIRRGGERRLLMLTPRAPYDARAQSFSPFL
jgi:hypothetical protein